MKSLKNYLLENNNEINNIILKIFDEIYSINLNDIHFPIYSYTSNITEALPVIATQPTDSP